MPEIGNGTVSFDTVQREWRCKFTGPADTSASLAELQKLLEKHLDALKALGEGVKVSRTVCGGCLDFKVAIAMPVGGFGSWESGGYAPEKDFLAAATKIDGVSHVETQTMTIMQM